MEELFQALSSSARIDKSKRPKKRKPVPQDVLQPSHVSAKEDVGRHAGSAAAAVDDSYDNDSATVPSPKSHDRTGTRDVSDEKQRQIQREQIAAFRRSMNIRLGNKHDLSVPDPLSSFAELEAPTWWKSREEAQNQPSSFHPTYRALLRNIENGRWKEPTPIQMQSLPTLLLRRDMIGAAPTGSGKSGAFILPTLLLASAPSHVFYDYANALSNKSKKKRNKVTTSSQVSSSAQGAIRGLLLAPSLELAAQLHREVERLGTGKPGGLTAFLLSKANASHAVAGTLGGKAGIDVLVTTPLRLVDCIEKGLQLKGTRIVVLDEADRLLDASDGKQPSQSKAPDESDSDDSGIQEKEGMQSGSAQSRSFLSQMDIILSEVPDTAVRGLFSATVTPMVRSLAESILRNPVDVSIAGGGAANPDIEQELVFVGREEGKLLAMRQLVARGDLHPPVIVFLQSQERAQALFEELLYDKIHVDVIHAGRSRSAREKAVANFRKGDTWVLICTDLVARGVDFRAVNMVINYDLPTSGITYVHRIGRTGRAGRKGKAITLFTEADFDNLRTIANVMKQSGCKVADWMLNLKKGRGRRTKRDGRTIDTTPSFDKKKRRKKQQMIRQSKEKYQRATPSRDR